MMNAMKEYFSYHGVLMCGLSELTLQGSLEDWKNLRARAAKLSQYGGVLAQWSEQLLPVLDQFVAAYQGKVDEPFWQKMITYKRLGSGGQKKFRGWFITLAPFDSKGKYLLNSKEKIEKTGVYATVADDTIQSATVAVPVTMDDNGVMHDLVFWGGVSMAQYDAQSNQLSPSVDWAIIDKKRQSKEAVLKHVLQYSYSDYSEVPEKYHPSFTAEEFDVARKAKDAKQAADRAAYLKKETEAREKLLALPKAELIQTLLKNNYWQEYVYLHADFKKAFGESEYSEAQKIRKQEVEKQWAEENKKREEAAQVERAKNLTLPHAEMMQKVMQESWYNDYQYLHEDYKKVITQEEFEAAASAERAKLKKQDGCEEDSDPTW